MEGVLGQLGYPGRRVGDDGDRNEHTITGLFVTSGTFRNTYSTASGYQKPGR